VTGWTPLAKLLLESAKNETPSAAAKAKVWSGVAATFAVGGATTGAVASIAPPAVAGGGVAALASAKMLLIGALLGSAVTLGIAATTFYARVQPLPPLSPTMAIAPVALRAANAVSSTIVPLPLIPAPWAEATASTAVAPPHVIAPALRAASITAPIAARSVPVIIAKPAASDLGEDALMQEASLVAEARSAIRRGDPESALSAIRAARALPSHQLVPEEAALEAQAVRAVARGAAPTVVGNAPR
jgi:hypothetical protein